ncbi:MAG: glycosyltransferase [Pseudomonadota bacterium]
MIPHLNQPDLLELCLRGVTAVRSGEGWALEEVLVCDNGSASAQGPDAVCARFEGVRVIDAADKQGPGPARNAGAAAASGDIIAFTDSDTQPTAAWLPAIAAAFSADPTRQVIGGDIRICAANPGALTPIEAYESVYSFRARDYVERDNYAATANMAVRRSVFDRVGPFGGIEIAEDSDWGRRAVASGVALHFVPEALVFHPARADFPALVRKWDRLTSHAWSRVDGAAGLAVWIAKAIALALSGPIEVVKIARSDRVSGISARRDAFLVLWRVRLYRAQLMLRLAFGASTRAASAAWRE